MAFTRKASWGRQHVGRDPKEGKKPCGYLGTGNKCKCPGVPDTFEKQQGSQLGWSSASKGKEMRETKREQMAWVPLSEAGALRGCGVDQGQGLTYVFMGSLRLLCSEWTGELGDFH